MANIYEKKKLKQFWFYFNIQNHCSNYQLNTLLFTIYFWLTTIVICSECYQKNPINKHSRFQK